MEHDHTPTNEIPVSTIDTSMHGFHGSVHASTARRAESTPGSATFTRRGNIIGLNWKAGHTRAYLSPHILWPAQMIPDLCMSPNSNADSTRMRLGRPLPLSLLALSLCVQCIYWVSDGDVHISCKLLFSLIY